MILRLPFRRKKCESESLFLIKLMIMKNVLFVISLVFIALTSNAQEFDIIAVQKTIETFFEGFHQQDSLIMKQSVADDMILQTIAIDSLGTTKVRETSFSQFLKGIVGIPENVKFQEIIKSFSIQVDGNMANAWTPYEFRLREKFSHCGVNSFQLVKFNDQWKIIYIIDTRRKENCD